MSLGTGGRISLLGRRSAGRHRQRCPYRPRDGEGSIRCVVVVAAPIAIWPGRTTVQKPRPQRCSFRSAKELSGQPWPRFMLDCR